MRLDDYIADAFVEKTDIFKNVHPNIITATSLILNVLILLQLLRWRNGINFGLFAALLATRCATDIFDGAVARKYKKSSKLGGYLDTIGDFTFFVILFYFAFDRFRISSFFWIPLVAFMLFTVQYFDVSHDHSSLKVYNGGPYQRVSAFLANNTVLTFIAIYFGVWTSTQ
jgi:phosphatidylglycerophosphate synthase